MKTRQPHQQFSLDSAMRDAIDYVFEVADRYNIYHDDVMRLVDLATGSHLEPDSGSFFGKHVFRRYGDGWVIVYEGKGVFLRHLNGFDYLAHLLKDPGRDFSPSELIALGEVPRDPGSWNQRAATRGAELREAGLTIRDLGDAGEILDPKAKAQYRERLNIVQGELDEARRNNDLGRIEQLIAERESIEAQLKAAVALRGRDRKAVDVRDRKRTAVGNAISRALLEIRDAHPVLAAHLKKSLKRGNSYRYRPEGPVNWKF